MDQNRLLGQLSATQAPFLPRRQPTGPSFLDTEACLCALQPAPGGNGGEGASLAAWQCIGNQTRGIYETTSGKWFEAADGSSPVDLPMYDASNPPRKDRELMLRGGSSLEPLDDAARESMDVYDRYCTAVNETTFSSAWYGAVRSLERNETPFDALPCWRPDAPPLPVFIQTIDDWLENGCSEGFQCKLLLCLSILDLNPKGRLVWIAIQEGCKHIDQLEGDMLMLACYLPRRQ